jgi:hypothetical protein
MEFRAISRQFKLLRVGHPRSENRLGAGREKLHHRFLNIKPGE